jgi:hypothetical protein
MKLTLVLLAATALAQAQEATLRAGVARVELTPSFSMPMYGYANRKCGPATGTHDPLFAKVLVLEAGASRMAIVTLDLGSIVSENLRRKAAGELGIPVLLLAASHTHSAPSYLAPAGTGAGLPPSSTGPSPYLLEIERKIFDAIRQAAGSMFAARLGVGRGSLQLGYNRLLLRDDGRARAAFNNLERIPYGPVDPEFTLLRVEDSSGAVRALVVHYACHAVVMGPTNCKYSADYPGVLQAKVEAEMKGAQCMFVQGGAGDVNPLFLGRKGNDDDDFAVMQKMGELLAAEVLRTARSIRAAAAPQPSIGSRSEVLKFANRWEKQRTMEVGITTVLINGEIAMAAVPGEPLHKLQTQWKARADVPHPLFYGYTYSSGGGWPGYIPDLRSAAYGGYGADVTTNIELGAGEAIIERHLVNLYGLRGMWRDKPGLP